MSAVVAARAIESGWRSVSATDELVIRPMSDGGPGFVAVVAEALSARQVSVAATGPLGEELFATIALHQDTAYIEVAQVCGLDLIDEADRNPEATTSAGVGDLIMAALDEGARRIVVGLGGTSTNDAGAGMLGALGATADGPLDAGARALRRITSVDLSKAQELLAGIELVSATDVDIPLLGIRGCSRSFAPQKGASEEQVMRLEGALENFASVIGRQADGKNPAVAIGAGAGGGLGYGLALLGAKRVPGIATVVDIVGLEALVASADLVITGEGKFDWQSLRGKVVSGVADHALNNALPCIVLAGQVQVGRREYSAIGVSAAYSVSDLVGGVAISEGAPVDSLSAAAARIAKTWSDSSGSGMK